MANWRRLPGLCMVIALLAAAPAAALTVTPPTFTTGGLVPAQVRETRVEAMAPQQRRAYIRGIQEALAARGFGPGPANGEIGPQTTTAIRDYQRDAGLPVTGRATKELLDHLYFNGPRVSRGMAPPVTDRELVEDVQVELAWRGYYAGLIDGVAGPRTNDAVRAFLRDAGLPETGMIDRRLLDTMLAADPAILAKTPM